MMIALAAGEISERDLARWNAITGGKLSRPIFSGDAIGLS
jgi:hypothetical protein